LVAVDPIVFVLRNVASFGQVGGDAMSAAPPMPTGRRDLAQA